MSPYLLTSNTVRAAALALSFFLIASATASAQIQNFTWQGDENDRWRNSGNWGQNPGSGDDPNASNHYVSFGDLGSGRDTDIDLTDDAWAVGQMIFNVSSTDYSFGDGSITNHGNVDASTGSRSVSFGSDVTYTQLNDVDWLGDGNGVTFNGAFNGSGKIDLFAPATFNAAGSYSGTMKIDTAFNYTGHATIGNANALQNAHVNLVNDNGLDVGGLNASIASLFGSGNLDMAGGSLNVGGTVDRTYSGNLTNSSFGSNFTYSGSATQTLTGSISGLNRLSATGGLLSLSGNTISLSGGAEILLNGGDVAITDATVSLNAVAPATGSVIRVNSNTLTLNNSQVTAARILAAAAGEIALNGNSMLTLGETGGTGATFHYDGLLTGPGSLRKVGAGSLTLTAANTYTGDTVIDGGSVVVGNANALENSTVEINVDGGLDLDVISFPRIGGLAGTGDLSLGTSNLTTGLNDDDTTYAGTLSGQPGSSLFHRGSGTLTLTGGTTAAPSTAGRFAVEQGVLALDGATVVATADTIVGSVSSSSEQGELTLSNGATLDTGDLWIGSAAGGTGLLWVGGGTDVTADQLVLGGEPINFGGTGLLVVEPSGSVDIVGETSFVDNNTSSITVNGGMFTTGTLLDNTFSTGNIAISDGPSSPALKVGTDGGSSTFEGNITDATGGPGSIHKVGAGTLTLNGSNTYTGGTNLIGGTLSLGDNAAAGTGDIIVDGGDEIYFNGQNFSNHIVLNNDVLFHASSTLVQLDGIISESGGSYGLDLRITNALALSGANTFTGGVQLGAGNLRLDHQQAVGTGDITVTGVSQITYGSLMGPFLNDIVLEDNVLLAVPGDSRRQDGVISDAAGSHGLMKTGNGQLVISQANTFGGGIEISEGVVLLENDAAAGTGAIMLHNGVGLAYADATTIANPVVLAGDAAVTIYNGTATQAGPISETGGSFSLSKFDPGTLRLTGSNTYTGGTAINGGTLLANNVTGSATGSGNVLVNGGGTLGGDGSVDGSVIVSDGGTLAPGNPAGVLTVDSVSLVSGSTFEVQIGGTTAETEFDMLDVTGTATLAGTLDVSLIDLGGGVYSPKAGDSFEILSADTLSGTFSGGESLPALSGLMAWNVNYDTVGNRIVLEVSTPFSADFDGDGDVDSNDLSDPVIGWQTRYGIDLDGSDFLTWQREYTGDLSLPLSAAIAAPEPSSIVLLSTLAAISVFLRRSSCAIEYSLK